MQSEVQNKALLTIKQGLSVHSLQCPCVRPRPRHRPLLFSVGDSLQSNRLFTAGSQDDTHPIHVSSTFTEYKPPFNSASNVHRLSRQTHGRSALLARCDHQPTQEAASQQSHHRSWRSRGRCARSDTMALQRRVSLPTQRKRVLDADPTTDPHSRRIDVRERYNPNPSTFPRHC